MTTQKQLKANRSNAQLSTGPKAPEGLEVSAQNARKHGLLSKALVANSEEHSEFDSFAQAIQNNLSPKYEMEHLLVERIISCAWRLRRILQIEILLFRPHEEWVYEKCTPFETSRRENILLLSRYEAALERSLYRAMHELRSLRAIC